MSPRQALATLLLGLVAASVSGCEQRAAGGGRARADAVASASAEMSGPALFSAEALTPALRALRAKATGKWLRLEIRAREIVLQAEDTRAAGAVLEYHYRDGAVGEPEQAALRGKGRLEDNLFDVGEVKLERIPELAREALRQVDPEAGSLELVLVRRDLPQTDEVRVRVYVTSPGKSGYLDADHALLPLP